MPPWKFLITVRRTGTAIAGVTARQVVGLTLSLWLISSAVYSLRALFVPRIDRYPGIDPRQIIEAQAKEAILPLRV